MNLKKDDTEERKTFAFENQKKKVGVNSNLSDDDLSSSLSPDVVSDDLLDRDSVKSMMKADETDIDHTVSDEQQKIVAIIPCFNEESTIGSVIVKARKYADEIVVIDDGSADETVKVSKDLGATVISHRFNLGKSAAVKTGFKHAIDANATFVVTLDGDGQHNAHEIPQLLNNLQNTDSDVVVGLRAGKKTEMPLYRRVGKRVLDYATSFGDQSVLTDSQSGFRAFNKKAMSEITPRLRG
ncbi:MAG: glycosyltransferase family 2 protein, partial [Candidatus Thermoplasmatota archaeon]|nr:glycosyltransferase family 2 protein [Candidatus Thermoplasmatota archaeon]